jgi:hypothetical protein
VQKGDKPASKAREATNMGQQHKHKINDSGKPTLARTQARAQASKPTRLAHESWDDERNNKRSNITRDPKSNHGKLSSKFWLANKGNKQASKHTKKQKDKQTNKQINKQPRTHTHTHASTRTPTNKQDKQTHKQTNRQRHQETEKRTKNKHPRAKHQTHQPTNTNSKNKSLKPRN